jgi:hypothetical protein
VADYTFGGFGVSEGREIGELLLFVIVAGWLCWIGLCQLCDHRVLAVIDIDILLRCLPLFLNEQSQILLHCLIPSFLVLLNNTHSTRLL